MSSARLCRKGAARDQRRLPNPPPTPAEDLLAEFWKLENEAEKMLEGLAIRGTVQAHREDRMFLEGAYRGQVNGEIQTAYDGRGRYEELADPKYTDTGGIFDIMAVTVIQTHLSAAA